MSTTLATPARTASTGIAKRAFQTTPADHRFFTIISIVMSVTIVAGFANTYLPKVVAGLPVPLVVHLHAVVFTSWLALFVIQTTLVLNGRTDLHRRLGIAGVVLAALMLVVGTGTAITVARLGHRGIPGVEFPDPEGFLLLNLAATWAFAMFVGAALYFRRNAQVHKRLMLLAVAGELVGPGVSRLPFVSGKAPLIAMLVLAFMFAGPVYDLVTRRRLHPAYWGLLLALTTIPPVAALLSATAAWHRIASLLLR